jgi:Putative restriction endonuclease
MDRRRRCSRFPSAKGEEARLALSSIAARPDCRAWWGGNWGNVGRKFAKYEEYGVKEYWVLDPKTLAHRFYSRRDNLLLEFGQNEEIIRSRSIPGFWVKRVWLDRQLRANPTVAEALAELVT